MLLLIDNYDSFTFNLKHYLEELGCAVVVVRNDKIKATDIFTGQYKGIILSPGPATPSKAGNLMQIIAEHVETTPMLGVCLGHQALGEYFGMKLVKAERPFHGKISFITHCTKGLFKNISVPMQVCRYHSLVLANQANNFLEITATTQENEIMSFKHKTLPVWGVQFHPEAILTPEGKILLHNWVQSL